MGGRRGWGGRRGASVTLMLSTRQSQYREECLLLILDRPAAAACCAITS
jgi:hypothetical protein